MALDLDQARRQLEKFLDQSKGGWLTDEASLTAMVVEMKEAGLIDATIEKEDDGTLIGAIVLCLTREGLDFLDAAAKPLLWTAAKERCAGKHLRDVTEALCRLATA